jgi:hypothetical protein
MHSSESEHSSDSSDSGIDPDKPNATAKSWKEVEDLYSSGSESRVPATPEKEFEEADGQSDGSDLHTPAQPSKRRHLTSPQNPTKQKRSYTPPSESESDGIDRDSLFDATPTRKRGFKRPRKPWSLVKEWGLDEYDREEAYEEIKTILAQSLHDAGSKTFIRPNANAISGWRPKQVSYLLPLMFLSLTNICVLSLQNYVSRKAESSTLNTFICPFMERCGCDVKFRIYATASIIRLEGQGEHTAESHLQDKVSKFLTVQQSSALEQMGSTNPMVSATTVRRGLELLPDAASKISPSKQRLVSRAVSAARARALEPFSQGEKLEGEEGSLTRLSDKIYLRTLVEEHNRGGKHLGLHQPVCLDHQFKAGVTFGCYSTPMLLLNAVRSVNAEWGFKAAFDTTFGISSLKFELMGITCNSLRKKANPICLCITKKEEATAYGHMYSSMEAGVFDLVHNLKLCKHSKKCEMCNAVREQVEQAPMRDLLTPPAKPKKFKNGAQVPFKFELPLETPMCDNTTKFSKWIKKKKPHLADKILQCAAHLTGIAWQKKSHTAGSTRVAEEIGTAGSTSCLAVRSVVPSIHRFLVNKSKEQASFWRDDTKARLKTSSAMFTASEEWR